MQVPAQLLVSLSDQLCSGSSSSLSTSQRQLLYPAACLLPDCTLFPPSHSAFRATPDVERQYYTSSSSAPGTAQGSAVEPVLCVEIKPKWGLLPTSPAISAKHEVKRHKSKFQLHQKLKLAQVCFYMHICGLVEAFWRYAVVQMAIVTDRNSVSRVQSVLSRQFYLCVAHAVHVFAHGWQWSSSMLLLYTPVLVRVYISVYKAVHN